MQSVRDAVERILTMVDWCFDESYEAPEVWVLRLPPQAVAAIEQMRPRPEDLAEGGEEVLGTYKPMTSPGIITLRWDRIGSVFWHHVLSLTQKGFVLTQGDLEGLATLAVTKTYRHERFHHFADVCRHLFGRTYERNLEEALAVACSYRDLRDEWRWFCRPGCAQPPLVREFISLMFDYVAPGYRDWRLYQTDHDFARALVSYLGPASAGFLEANRVDVAGILMAVRSGLGDAGVVTRVVP